MDENQIKIISRYEKNTLCVFGGRRSGWLQQAGDDGGTDRPCLREGCRAVPLP